MNIEETDEFLPDFNKIDSTKGVVPVAVQNAGTGEVILIAYTNREALNETIKSGVLTLWSTTRNELWVKGKTSGQYFNVVQIFVNCEQNSLVYKVLPRSDKGGICHTKNQIEEHRNCFYRELNVKTNNLKNQNP